MAETSKKKPRKSKLVLRECVELYECTNTQMQEPIETQAATQSLLPKLKNAIDNESHIENSPTPVQFSIEVDVESCEHDSPDEDIENETDGQTLVLLRSMPRSEVIIKTETILKEAEKLSLKSYSDKKLYIEMKNMFGTCFVKQPVLDKYEQMVQNVLLDWRNWYGHSKIRTSILAYKCNICSIGWWFLHPFQEHIRIHEEVSLRLDTYSNECCIVAAQGQWFESICLCKIEGCCPKCLQKYESHSSVGRGDSSDRYYHCVGCSSRFSTCWQLFRHEGECVRYEKIVYRDVIPTESMWKCDICATICLTQKRYELHYRLEHSVRSDCPTIHHYRRCADCNAWYHVRALHTCPERASNARCKHCCRRFQHKVMADLHLRLNGREHYCPVCNRYLRRQCMDMEHLLKHSKNFLLVYKCCACLDNVLCSTESVANRHCVKWHSKPTAKRFPHLPMLVPRSVMFGTWVDGVTIEDMAAGKAEQKSSSDDERDVYPSEKTIEPGYADSLAKIIQRDVEINQKSIDLRNKMLQRACSNAQSSKQVDTWSEFEALQQADEVLAAVEGLKSEANDDNEDERIKQENDTDERIKEENDDADDDDIAETQNSVDALLLSTSYVNIKDEIEIHEPVWDQIVIEDSEDGIEESVSQTGSSQDSIYQIQDSQESVNFSIVKQEPVSEKRNDEKNVTIKNKTNHIDIKTEVVKELEIKNNDEINEETDDIRQEHEACLQELSKVFRASKDAGALKLTGISLAEEVTIKEEPIDEDDYEDDIIMFYNDKKMNFDVTVTAEDVKKENAEEASTSEESKDLNSEISSQISIDLESKRIARDKKGRFKKVLTDAGEVVQVYDKKIYQCKKCKFVGEHKEFNKHKTTVCKRKKQDRVRKWREKNIWPEIVCTKCDTDFKNLRSYFLHFSKHGFKKGRCPKCSREFQYINQAVGHLTSHIKHSFMKVRLLKASGYDALNRSLYQCKVCQDRVEFKKFFVHWEKHLDLVLQAQNEENEEDKDLVIDEEMENNEKEEKDQDGTKPQYHQLPPDKIKQLLDQMTDPMEGIKTSKECILCRRVFARRNDVKRHVIEHLLRDAHSRGYWLACQLCGQQYNNDATYKIHMRNHAALPVFNCEMCNRSFSDSSNFAKHKKVHNLHVLSICDLCKKKFHSKMGLEKHMKMHATTEPIPCARCDRIFYTESAYKKHQKTKHDKITSSRLCKICMMKFTRLRSMWDHMWEVHKERQQKADCHICKKQFRKYQDVRAHLRTEHHDSNFYGHPRRLVTPRLPLKKSSALARVPAESARTQSPAPKDEDDVEAFLETNSEVTEDYRQTLVVFEDLQFRKYQDVRAHLRTEHHDSNFYGHPRRLVTPRLPLKKSSALARVPAESAPAQSPAPKDEDDVEAFLETNSEVTEDYRQTLVVFEDL